jgi:hypothetical protein
MCIWRHNLPVGKGLFFGGPFIRIHKSKKKKKEVWARRKTAITLG